MSRKTRKNHVREAVVFYSTPKFAKRKKSWQDVRLLLLIKERMMHIVIARKFFGG